MMNNNMFLKPPVERENQTTYWPNFDMQTNLPLQSSTMTVSEVLALMGTYMSHMKMALEMGRAVHNDEIEQLKAKIDQLKTENEKLRLTEIRSQRKAVNPHD